MRRETILQAGVIVAAAALCAGVSNSIAGPERRLAWVRREPAGSATAPRPTPASAATAATPESVSSAPRAFAPHPDRPYVEISGDDASRLFGQGVPFFDARRSSVYREGHVAGARSFPVWEADIDERVRAFFAEGANPSAPLVAYCSGGDCEDSHTLAQKLYMAGFDNVLVYKDGFPDWVRRGLPVHTGEKP